MAANAGYLFYKRNYKVIPGEFDSSVNEMIENIEVVPVNHPGNYSGWKVERIPLKTAYPGLIAGVGYGHEAKGTKDIYKLGFYFDHSTGMPVIPGSSVKGAIRSLFPNRYRLTKQNIDWWVGYSTPRYELIRQLLVGISGNSLMEISGFEIDVIESEIFEGVVNGESVSIYERDIFLDAIPVKVASMNCGSKRQLFGSDYLTPHLHEDRAMAHLDTFAEPNPVKFLKVMPEVVYEFHFRLQDSKEFTWLTVGNKRALIKALLEYHGVGAKTNVGYGQFEQSGDFETYVVNRSSDLQGASSKGNPTDPEIYHGKVELGKVIQAKVIDPQKKLVQVYLESGQIDVPMARLVNWPEPGAIVKASIADASKGIIRMVSYLGPL